MRIGIVTPGFSASERDWCIPVLLDLVRSLAAAGHDVTVVALRYPHQRSRYRVFGAEVIALGGGTLRGLARLPFLAAAVIKLAALHRRRRFSVLHAIWAHEPGLVVTLTRQLTRVPTLVSVFGGELVALEDISYGGQLQRSNRWSCRWALDRADRIAFGSLIQRRLIETVLAGDDSTLIHAPLGVDTDLFQPCVSSSGVFAGNPVLVSVGSLVAVKDHATLLRAFVAVATKIPTAQLHLFGDGPLREQLVQQAESLGIGRSVHFRGEVRRERLPEIFSSADLAVISSRSEHIPMVCLEALACGCPTVGTAVGVLPELEQLVRVTPPGDSRALSASILEELASAERSRARGQRGLELVRARFSLHQSALRHEQIYAELAREHDATLS